MPEEYVYELKIPKERVAVLIGKDGEVKKKLEGPTGIKIDVDSEEGDCFLKGKDALALFTIIEVVKAIGRGFNPDIAMLLFKQDYVFDIVPLTDYYKNKNAMHRVKGRVIGEKGKCRRTIEELTESHISVYGKTVSIIGGAENVAVARRAVESILRGDSHGSVYKWLEKQRRNLKVNEFIR